ILFIKILSYCLWGGFWNAGHVGLRQEREDFIHKNTVVLFMGRILECPICWAEGRARGFYP
ncbi:hypothetical protein, partial [Desulfolutivibrio sp.]|uniref:hypothetical protein n=1 Tax=Desulfolutivibrio sp. TaxID=2773296 RepID=UPI002F960A96